jgi:predicted site-specific integrase-resolvase
MYRQGHGFCENCGHAVRIVHTFSCRLYGLRRYEKALKDELGPRGR